MFGPALASTSTILGTRVSADGNPKYKAGGITVALGTLTAASGSDITHPDGSIIKAGNQFLRYGQIMCMVTSPEVQVVTVNGSPTGGTFTLTLSGQTTAAIAFDAAAATVQTALRALSNVGSTGVTVTGSAGGPFTATFAAALGELDTLTATSSLTGGTTPSVTMTTSSQGSEYGKYGPYNPAASDGRQTIARGACFILDQTWLYTAQGVPGFPANDNIGGVFEAGDVWKARVLQSGVATHTLALGPTLAEFEAAFPRISYYTQDH